MFGCKRHFCSLFDACHCTSMFCVYSVFLFRRAETCTVLTNQPAKHTCLDSDKSTRSHLPLLVSMPRNSPALDHDPREHYVRLEHSSLSQETCKTGAHAFCGLGSRHITVTVCCPSATECYLAVRRQQQIPMKWIVISPVLSYRGRKANS